MSKSKSYTIETIASDEGLTNVVRRMWEEGFFSESIMYRHADPEQINEAIEDQKARILSRGESWFSNQVVELKFLMNSWGNVQIYNSRNSSSKLIEELFDIVKEDQQKNLKR